MKAGWFYIIILVAALLGWLVFEWLKKMIQPKNSSRRGLLFFAVALLFIFCWTGGIVFLVRLIFGKPS